MKVTIKKIVDRSTESNLAIEYQTHYGIQSFEVAKNGWCDLNDLDEFCEACIPGYLIGYRSIDQMVDLAKKIYRHYKQENKKAFHPTLPHKVQGLFFEKQFVKNKVRPSNIQTLRYAGV